MRSTRSALVALAVTAAAAVGVPAGAASAADADVVAACEALQQNNLNAGGVITNLVSWGSAGTIGCVTTVHTSTGAISSATVSVVSGWTYTVKRSTDRVSVEFRSAAGDKVTYRIEPGKLVIR